MKIPKAPTRAKLEKAGIRIVVGVLKERAIMDDAFLQFWDIAKRGYDQLPFLYGRTDEIRNRMGDALLKSNYTHVCMLDSDHIHAADIVEHLARWVLQDRRRLVVGGLNYRRTAPYDPCIYRAIDGHLTGLTEWEQGLIPVDGLGTGCILISREAFETLEPPWFAYGYEYAQEGIYPAEDLYFSIRARNAGINLYCDTTVTSPHIGKMYIDSRMWRGYLKANQSSNGHQEPALEVV